MSIVLDVAIGIIFLYLLLALLVTTLQELLASWLDLRADNLYRAIEGMLAAPPVENESDAQRATRQKLFTDFYNHPLIKNLRAASSKVGVLRRPSYIPSRTFALALLDVLRTHAPTATEGSTSNLLNEARASISKLEHADLKRSLELFFENPELSAERFERSTTKFKDDAERQLSLVSKSIESWFNARMSRASGWYKRKAQSIAFGLACALAIATNADSIHVATTLWQNDALRAQIAATAAAYYAVNAPSTPSAQLAPTSAVPSAFPTAADKSTASAELRAAEFPIGWGQENFADIHWSAKAFGLLITALAVSLGAGFWFDLLGKALQIRGTGPRISVKTGRVEL